MSGSGSDSDGDSILSGGGKEEEETGLTPYEEALQEADTLYAEHAEDELEKWELFRIFVDAYAREGPSRNLEASDDTIESAYNDYLRLFIVGEYIPNIDTITTGHGAILATQLHYILQFRQLRDLLSRNPGLHIRFPTTVKGEGEYTIDDVELFMNDGEYLPTNVLFMEYVSGVSFSDICSSKIKQNKDTNKNINDPE